MGLVQELAADLDADERTLRRAASQGTLRCRRPRPRLLRLAPGERDYLQDHWHLLAELRKTLRTERRVRLAVLYGSIARGDEDAGSDLDLLVSFVDGRSEALGELRAHIEGLVGRRVDVARLDRVEADAPLLLDRIMDEGRVLIDRDDQWRRLRARRRAIRARAQRAFRRQMAGAARAIADLTR